MSNNERLNSLPSGLSISSRTPDEADFMLSRDCRYTLLRDCIPIIGGRNPDGSVTFTLPQRGIEKVEELMRTKSFEPHQVEKE